MAGDRVDWQADEGWITEVAGFSDTHNVHDHQVAGHSCYDVLGPKAGSACPFLVLRGPRIGILRDRLVVFFTKVNPAK